MNMRGLFDGTLSFDADDVVSTKIIPVYLNMLVNRGRYFAAHGQYDRAIQAYRRALELDPDFHIARQSLAEASISMEKAAPAASH
jgi:tetratricopeptide (TPR) repeat protein